MCYKLASCGPTCIVNSAMFVKPNDHKSINVCYVDIFSMSASRGYDERFFMKKLEFSFRFV